MRPIAHTRSPPWMLIFPYFNGTSLGDIMEMVPYPAHIAKMLAIQDGNGKVKLPLTPKKMATEEELQRGENLCLHAPSFIHAFVQSLAYAHKEGIIHNDLHPWNIMVDFTAAGVPRVGNIDWRLALRAGVDQRATNIHNQLQHKLRPWRADELFSIKHRESTHVHGHMRQMFMHLLGPLTPFANFVLSFQSGRVPIGPPHVLL